MLSSASHGHPNLVASTCISRATRNQTHGILPYLTRKTLYSIGSSIMRPNATVFLRFDIALFRHFLACSFFDFFDFFNLPINDLLFLPVAHLSFNRPSLVASNTSSDAPEPLFTSDFYHRCYQHRCRPILTSREEILAFLELRTCSTNNPST